MQNKEIVIDAGHGGSDPGAIGNEIIEKDINLAISQYMYDRFRELGIPVKMVRETDETVDPATRTERILNAFGNKDNVVVISNHINAGGGEGAEVIYALRNTNELADLVLQSLGSEGLLMRKSYQRRLPSDTSKDYYFIHRNTGITEPIIVEYGFLDNINDANKLKQNYDLYSEVVVRAVLEYIGYGEEETYTVKSGDSLWTISKRYNITVEELKAANNLSSNLLNIGQVLNIPSKKEPVAGEYIVYTVVSGDNLYDIAQKYNKTVSELVDYNNLATTNLFVGQRIFIPVVTEIKPEPTSNYDTYTVVRGDSLYSIATKYNTNVNELMNINNLSSNLLSVGQRILVPRISQTGESTYIVKRGDSLYSIANQYGISVDSLKNANNLSNNLLSVGQTLTIPPTSLTTHVVKRGDSLYSIANQYGVTVDSLKAKNNLSSNLLSIGQVLNI